MLKDVVSNLGMELLAIIALVVFFVIFVAIVVWVLMRPRKEIQKHAQIPLEDQVVEPREGEDEKDEAKA